MATDKFNLWYFVVVLVLLSLSFLVSCTIPTTTTPTTTTPTETQLLDESDNVIRIWTDPDTNVQYIIYHDKVGYAGHGGITPRLNSDGTLYIITQTEKGE